MSIQDRDQRFHETWLGLAQPVSGLVFSLPVLSDAQIAPEPSRALSVEFAKYAVSEGGEPPRVADLARFFREFLGYDEPGMLAPRAELGAELSFYAAEGGQELRPSYALGRGPFVGTDDPFAAFEDAREASEDAAPSLDAGPDAKAGADAASRYWALVWDLTESGEDLDLDAAEAVTGPWRYPPTAKFERLLRHTGVAVGLLFNGRELRLVYAPLGESTAHLTFRFEHLVRAEGRPLLAALELLLHARRAYAAAHAHTVEGLLAESRRRQADVTLALAKQVFEAVETLVHGFEEAARRGEGGEESAWLRSALEAEGDHLYQGVLSVVLRLVFLLYAEDQSLMPVEQPLYAEHLGLGELYERLSADAGAHPESMHHRFGAYGRLLALFRAVYFGVEHGAFCLPPRSGRLFDPSAYPFLEGGLVGSVAVVEASARARVRPPGVDDGTLHRVLRGLVVFEGQRLSYRTLDVEQLGSVYESLMGYHVLRLSSGAVRVGARGVWVEAERVRAMSPTDRARFFKEECGLNPGPVKALEAAIAASKSEADALEALGHQAMGKRAELARHEAGPGRLVLQPGAERRRTGSHYTPRFLTEKIARRTLEPLLACLGPGRTAEQLLSLKVCDPAMGSGAFLVAVCRALGAELVSAWTRSGELARVLEAHNDPHLHAYRLVAQTCLYGVDKNPAAVELGKLSLWLVTLSRDLPFTFVDHALRHGDSLVGLDFEQIASFHWTPDRQLPLVHARLREALDESVALRQRILGLADHDEPSAQADKRRLLAESREATDKMRTIADVCVGAFFAEPKDAAREKERRRRLDLIERWLDSERVADDPSEPEARRAAATQLARRALDELRPLADEAALLAPFHWGLEFPEVFYEERPDPLQGGVVNGAARMEAVVGNPPFGGKNNIIDGNALGYLDWLKVVSPGAHGNSDLSAHFFRRASMLLGEHGAFGLIATNTISQGDTRTTGLAALVNKDWELYDATESMPWPGAAAVTVSIVHAAHGRARNRTERRLDGKRVSELNSRLKPKPEREDAKVLQTNANQSFQGSIVLGMGFTLSPEEREALITKNARNAERIFPYLGGEEVNTSPTQSFHRYVISFGQMELEQAERWPDLIRIVREKVKPERDRNNRDNYRLRWWQFGEYRPGLYAAIAPLDRCLVTAIVSKHLIFSFQPTDRVFSHKLFAFPLHRFTAFAVLQSRIHTPWVWLLSSTMKTDLNYSASDCFETFPFPEPDPRAVLPEVEAAGERLYQARAAFMLETDQGLTKTYNALKDPSATDPRILELRRLHEAMDRAVLAAYTWQDLPVPPYCPQTDADKEALRGFEDEVIDRLYALNAERARQEENLGLGKKKTAAKAPGGGKQTKGGAKAKGAKKAEAPEGQGGLGF